LNGLRTARVVVVDDDLEEGSAIFSALSRAGIGCLYFSDDPEELPEKGVEGVRLYVLDMVLGLHTAENDRQKLSSVISVVSRLIPSDPAPFVIIVWSNHPELSVKFEEYLREVRPDIRHFHRITLSKPEFFSTEENGRKFDIEKIMSVLEKTRPELFPFDLILEWEQRVHDAASHTTGALTNAISEGDNSNWRDELQKIMAALSIASGGRTLSTGIDVLKAFYSALNPIHEDRLEHLAINTDAVKAASDALKKVVDGKPHNKSLLLPEQNGQLNKIFCLADIGPEDKNPQPGNVYLVKDWTGRCYISNDEVPESQLIVEAFSKVEDEKTTNHLVQECTFGMVEITPACDYSQGHNIYSRLLPCLLIPEEVYSQVEKKSPARKHLGPLSTEDEDIFGLKGTFYIVLTSRFSFGITTQELSGNTPAFRIRSSVLVDIQAWYASQVARPGYLQLR
jgi:hypothetical protein